MQNLPRLQPRPAPRRAPSIKQGGLVGVHAGSNHGLITRAARVEHRLSLPPLARALGSRGCYRSRHSRGILTLDWTSFAGRQWRGCLFLRSGCSAVYFGAGGMQVTDLGKGSSCTRSIIAGRQGQLVLLDFFLACAPPVEDKKGAAAPSGFADHSPTHCTLQTLLIEVEIED
jgi:hypothetical protein